MSEKKMTDWTLGEVMELCKSRTGTHACAGCPMESEMEHDYCRLADVTWPDHWEIPMSEACKPTLGGILNARSFTVHPLILLHSKTSKEMSEYM